VAVARANGLLEGKKPKLSVQQEAVLVSLHEEGEHSARELAEMFGVARFTVYRAVERAAVQG